MPFLRALRAKCGLFFVCFVRARDKPIFSFNTCVFSHNFAVRSLRLRLENRSLTCCYQNHLPNGGRRYYRVLRRAYIINLIINFLKYFIYYDYNNSYFNIYKFINP